MNKARPTNPPQTVPQLGTKHANICASGDHSHHNPHGPRVSRKILEDLLLVMFVKLTPISYHLADLTIDESPWTLSLSVLGSHPYCNSRKRCGFLQAPTVGLMGWLAGCGAPLSH